MRLSAPVALPSHSSARIKKYSSPLVYYRLLESRNDEQAATDRNQVFDQSNVEVWLAQGLYEPSASMIAGETTDDSSDHSQPSTNESRPSTAKRNARARQATCHD